MDRWVRTSDAPQACNRSVRKRERWRATYAASRGDEGVRTSVGVRLGIRGSMDGLIQVCSSSFVAPIHRPVGEGIHVGALSSALHEQIFFIAPHSADRIDVRFAYAAETGAAGRRPRPDQPVPRPSHVTVPA